MCLENSDIQITFKEKQFVLYHTINESTKFWLDERVAKKKKKLWKFLFKATWKRVNHRRDTWICINTCIQGQEKEIDDISKRRSKVVRDIVRIGDRVSPKGKSGFVKLYPSNLSSETLIDSGGGRRRSNLKFVDDSIWWIRVCMGYTCSRDVSVHRCFWL